MSIKVTLKAPGIESISGQREFSLQDNVTLRDLLTHLGAEFGEAVDEGFIVVNCEVVRRDQAAETRLKDGDEILLVPPMALG